MSKIRVCDICGKEIVLPHYGGGYRPHAKCFQTKIKYDDGTKVKMEWCEQCMDSFKLYLTKQNLTSNPAKNVHPTPLPTK